MKKFIIKDKWYESTSTPGNYSKVIQQLVNDWGTGNVYFKVSHRHKIAFMEWNYIEFTIKRSLSTYKELYKAYMTPDDAMRLLDFTPSDFVPDANGKLQYFPDYVKLEKDPTIYVSIKDVRECYWNVIANNIRGTKFEWPGKIEISVNSSGIKVHIDYKAPNKP